MQTLASILNLFDGPQGIFILLIIVLLFGAKKLPELARGMGQAIREFQKAKDEHPHADETAPAPPIARIEDTTATPRNAATAEKAEPRPPV